MQDLSCGKLKISTSQECADGLNKLVSEFANRLQTLLSESNSKTWICVTKVEIEDADGREKQSSPICQNGSILYIAYEEEVVLYVGETSKSIKRRFCSDGSGAHKNRPWYQNMTYVKFVQFTEASLPTKFRKALEQMLAIIKSPTWYGGKESATPP
jgi:hypothetical protein